jgi:hypothetical protein
MAVVIDDKEHHCPGLGGGFAVPLQMVTKVAQYVFAPPRRDVLDSVNHYSGGMVRYRDMVDMAIRNAVAAYLHIDRYK